MVKSSISPEEQAQNLSCGTILKAFGLPQTDAESYSPLTLAYLGDCVYEIIVRSVVVGEGNTSANRLNRRASNLCKASAQSMLVEAIRDRLTETEAAVYRRGRNAKSATTAKNASIADYRRATGLEALCGYLYLKGQTDRLLALLADGIEKIRTGDGNGIS